MQHRHTTCRSHVSTTPSCICIPHARLRRGTRRAAAERVTTNRGLSAVSAATRPQAQPPSRCIHPQGVPTLPSRIAQEAHITSEQTSAVHEGPHDRGLGAGSYVGACVASASVARAHDAQLAGRATRLKLKRSASTHAHLSPTPQGRSCGRQTAGTTALVMPPSAGRAHSPLRRRAVRAVTGPRHNRPRDASTRRARSPLPSRTAQEAHITSEQTPAAYEGPHDQPEDSAADASKWRLSEQWGDPVRLPDPALTARAFSAGPGRIHLLRSWYHASV